METTPKKTSGGLWSMAVEYFRGFRMLKRTRSEYWGLQLVNILDSTTFFSILAIAVVMLSDDFGFSDVQAGYVVTIYGSTTTISLFLSGMITDWLGIRKSLLVAMVGQFISRGAVVVTALFPAFLPDYRGLIVTAAFFLMAPFVAMVQTAFQAGNKRFTTRTSRGAGFNLWYLFMNVGAAAGGFLIDIIRKLLHLPNGHIFTFAVIAHVVSFFLILFLVRREDQLLDEGEVLEEKKEEHRSPWQVAAAVLRESVFWRFMVLTTLLLGVRAVFLYMSLLWPKYWLRVIGPDAAIGTLQAVNPILVIIGLILFIPILNRFSVYKMLTYGGMVSALSLFVLAIPAWGQTAYLTSLAALVVLTIGEVIWSPRLQEYTAAIAPEGQEGTYLGLSMVPYFLAKTVVGFLSGYMLARWVPEFPKGTPILRDRLASGAVHFWDSPSALWILLGVIALVGPVVALLLKNWFTKGAHWERSRQAEDPV